MEKIDWESEYATKHLFYCDGCNKYLGDSEEHDDGWYHEYGEFGLKFYVYDDWYKLKKHLCDDCRNAFITDLKTSLESVGFYKQ